MTTPSKKPSTRAVRMTGTQRREQLIEVGRGLFARHGFEGTSVEEIASAAKVSKPVVYEHFGGKEGLYAVVVDREIAELTAKITEALILPGTSKQVIERAALALLDYIEKSSDGFRILVRDGTIGQSSGSYATLISDVTSQVQHILVAAFKRHKLDPKAAPMYAQMLVGSVALVGQWWLDHRSFKKADVAAHVVNLAWNGLTALDRKPQISARVLNGPVVKPQVSARVLNGPVVQPDTPHALNGSVAASEE